MTESTDPHNFEAIDFDDSFFQLRLKRTAAPKLARRQIPPPLQVEGEYESDPEISVNLTPELFRINTYHNLTTLDNIRSSATAPTDIRLQKRRNYRSF